MGSAYRHTWRRGDRLTVRGSVWRVVERTGYADCESLRLLPARDGVDRSRTLLLPFDRPRPLAPAHALAVTRPRAWLHRLRTVLSETQPAGALSAAAKSTITLLPYQLEPALLMRREGVSRVMIADGVGLGKTVQAGILLNELAAEHESIRALVVVPAGLREQWRAELRAHFDVESAEASSPWLARAAAALPPDVNPWSLPGVYIASIDLVKRPEVLRPLEEVTWDVVVVDEAHDAALGTARRAAVHALATRARRVVLLTATPHTGDAEQFAALCALGAIDASEAPIVLFRRTRADVAPHAARRTRMLAVRPTAAERRMHRLLESYTARLCDEARARGDLQARLVAIVLRKRALSSASSLAASCARRLVLLQSCGPEPERQLLLPLADEDALPDGAPDSILGAKGFADVDRERRWLIEIEAAASLAAARESKIAFLARLLRRHAEPVIVFTEFRDTLEHVRRALAHVRPDLEVLHGALGLPERAAAQYRFNTRASLLLATDAASQGLNLHVRCRAVVHFELPWSPARLEQRTGRVDRIGQSRRVHELLLVADDTAERLVLGPLLARAARSRADVPDGSRVAGALAESHVVAAMLDGLELPPPDQPSAPTAYRDPPPGLRQQAVAETARLGELRQWQVSSKANRSVERTMTTAVTCCRQVRGVSSGTVAIYSLAIDATDGTPLHRQLIAVHCRPSATLCRRPAELRAWVERFRQSRDAQLREFLERHSADLVNELSQRLTRAALRAEARERAMLSLLPCAASSLVQAGLFDQRASRAAVARVHAADLVIDESERRIQAVAASRRFEVSLQLSAVLLVSASRHA